MDGGGGGEVRGGGVQRVNRSRARGSGLIKPAVHASSPAQAQRSGKPRPERGTNAQDTVNTGYS